MALQARTEFASALNQVCSERGVEPEVVIDSIKQAILAAYRKDYGDPEGIDVDLDANTGEVGLKKGKKDVTPAGFGRIAAQTAKQVILQRIREAEKSAIMEEYSSKVNTIVSGTVQRISGPVVTVNLGKAEGIMPPQEQSHNEKYLVKFYVVGIKEGPRGEEIILSRNAPGLLGELFKQEVPEINSGSVEIKAVAREGGTRSKIAVYSGQLGVDPVGSCVGQKGVRVQAVMNELGDERIDIIQYQENPEEFIKSALSPAKELQVKINDKEKTAEVTVPDDQLSLAIGKEGQNVRLAAKLTGYKIDIKGKSGTPKEVEEKEKAAQEEAKKALGITEEDKEEKAPKEEGTKEKTSASAEEPSASQSKPADDQSQPDDQKQEDEKENTEKAQDQPAGETEESAEKEPAESVEAQPSSDNKPEPAENLQAEESSKAEKEDETEADETKDGDKTA